MTVRLDKSSADAARLLRIADKPYLAETGDIIALAACRGVAVTERDIKGQPGDYTIDGMEWFAWLDAVTQA